MKRGKLLPAALAPLLLAACGAQAPLPAPPEPVPAPEQEPIIVENTVSLPETAGIKPVSVPAAVTEGRAPAKRYDLPAGRDYRGNMMRLAAGGGEDFPALLAEEIEADAAFYGVGWDTALIRWGDSQAEFDWFFATPRQYLPEMFCFDLDGDREDELIVLCYSGSGTGVSIYDLHVLEKNPDGTLTDYALPESLFDSLSECVSIHTAGERIYAVLGTELVDLTRFTEDGADIRGLRLGDTVYYDVNPEQILLQRVRLLASAWAESDYFPPTAGYVVDLEATVSYGDGVFTLSEIHLNGNS